MPDAFGEPSLLPKDLLLFVPDYFGGQYVEDIHRERYYCAGPFSGDLNQGLEITQLQC
jgi:hypothetical protein